MDLKEFAKQAVSLLPAKTLSGSDTVGLRFEKGEDVSLASLSKATMKNFDKIYPDYKHFPPKIKNQLKEAVLEHLTRNYEQTMRNKS